MRKFTLLFAALLVALGVSAQTLKKFDNGYFEFPSRVTEMTPVTSAEQLANLNGQDIVIKHCHDHNDALGEGSERYLTLNSAIVEGSSYHTTLMYDVCSGLSMFTLEMVKDTVDGIPVFVGYRLKTIHAKTVDANGNTSNCYLSNSQTLTTTTNVESAAVLKFDYVTIGNDEETHVVMSEARKSSADKLYYYYATQNSGQSVMEQTSYTKEAHFDDDYDAKIKEFAAQNQETALFNMYTITATEGVTTYVQNANFNLAVTGSGAPNTISGEGHEGWSDMYNFMLKNNVTISNSNYDANQNLITGNITFRFPVSGSAKQSPVRFQFYGHNQYYWVGSESGNTVATLTEDVSDPSQWYIYAGYEQANKEFVYKIKNASLNKYLAYESIANGSVLTFTDDVSNALPLYFEQTSTGNFYFYTKNSSGTKFYVAGSGFNTDTKKIKLFTSRDQTSGLVKLSFNAADLEGGESEEGGGDDENSEEYIWRYSTSVSLGNRITDVASLTEGQKVVFKNVGQGNYITIHRGTLKANAQATANGLSVFTVHKNGDKFTFESARPDYYFPTIVNYGWPGYYMTTTPHEFEVSTTHANGSAAGEGRFVIKDATTNAYFDGGANEFTGWQGNGDNSKFEIYPVTMGEEFHALIPYSVEITDNVNYVHTGRIEVWSDNNVNSVLGKGYHAGELNLTFADNKVTGTVNFGEFPVSSLDANPNMVLVSSYPNNYALFYWRANGDNIETEKNAKPNVSNLDAYAWAIYPKLESDGFKFYLQNVATGNYLTSTKTTNSHAAGDITLSETGTGFTVEANDKFKFVTGMYISTNSSAPGNPVQSLGVYNSGHTGTQNRIHSFVDVVKESLVKTGVGYPAITSTEYQNVATLDGTEGFETVKSRFEAYYNCEDVQMPESGKAYKISAWWRTRTLPLTFITETSVGGLNVPAYVPTENAADENVAVFVCRKMEDGTYAFVTDNGYYLGWQTDNSSSNATSTTYSDGTHWKVEKAVTGSNTGDLKQTELFGKLLLRANATATGVGKGWFAYMYSYSNTSKHFHNAEANALYYGDNAHTVYYTFEEVPAYTLNKVGLATIQETDKLLIGSELTDKTIGTFSAPYATVIPEGVTAYYAAEAEEAGQLILKPVVGDALPAEQGVVLIGNASSATMLPVAGETIATIDGNVFEHSATGPVTMGANAYILANGGQGIGIYKATAGSTLKQGKAYLNFTGSSANSFVLNFSGVTTDIEGAPTVAPSQQVIYDLSGRRVNAVTKGGIYIVNGKKMIIK